MANFPSYPAGHRREYRDPLPFFYKEEIVALERLYFPPQQIFTELRIWVIASRHFLFPPLPRDQRVAVNVFFW